MGTGRTSLCAWVTFGMVGAVVALGCGKNFTEEYTFECASNADCASGYECLSCGSSGGRCVTNDDNLGDCGLGEIHVTTTSDKTEGSCRPVCGQDQPTCQSGASCSSHFSTDVNVCMCDDGSASRVETGQSPEGF